MVFDFRADAPVLNLGPRTHVKDVPFRNREYLLWPALAYRVVSPLATAHELNFLQRAVLGLCGAGCREPGQISDRLHIHSQLTSLILDELRRKKLIDREGITERAAQKFTARDPVRSDEIVSGWVFQDPWSGELWPRFVTKMDYCQTEADDEGFVKLVFGTTGNPWLQRAFMQIPPREVSLPQPTPLQVLRAAENHRRTLRRAKEAESFLDDSGSPAETSRVERIAFIEPQPRPVFLMTYLYLPPGDNAGPEWYVCEPFGFDPSVKFRHDLDSRLADSKGLLTTVQRLLSNSVHGDMEHYRSWRERLREDAVLKVDLNLTIAARLLSGYPHFVEMEMAYEESVVDASAYNLRRVAGSCRAALEALFRDVAARYPLRGISNALYTNGIPNRNRQFVQECYRKAYATVGCSDDLPRSLLSVKPENVRAVAEYDDSWRLRPSIVATLLTAARVADHPLRAAIAKTPNLLWRLDAVAQMSGEAVHSGEVTFSLEDASVSMQTVYIASSQLMDLPMGEVSV